MRRKITDKYLNDLFGIKFANTPFTDRIFAKFTNKNYYEHIQIIERLPVLKVIKAYFKGFLIYTHLVLFSDIYAFSLIS